MQYIINSDYILNKSENFNTIFTSDMKKVYVLKKIESIIVEQFLKPITIDDAIKKITEMFDADSFNIIQCNEFIDELFSENILVQC